MLTLLLALQGVQAPEIVVNGRRTADALAACRARECPPNQEGNAALAHADQQFLGGDYRGARGTLTGTLSRIKSSASRYPRVVAALYEALSQVGLHSGDTRLFRQATSNSVRTLDAYLPANSPQALFAAGRYGDMWTTLGNTDEARRSYRAAENAADRAGNINVRDAIMLRRAWLEHARGNMAQAVRLVSEVATNPSPAFRMAARILTVRMAASRGDGSATDALIDDLRKLRAGQKPVLAFAPPLAPSALKSAQRQDRQFGPLPGLQSVSGSAPSIRWADIGYWIHADGRTAEAEVLRGSRDLGWTTPILANIVDRRYLPFDAEPGDPGSYRIERYSLAATYVVPVGSLIRQRTGPPELRILDLSDAAVDPAAPKAD